MKLTQMAIKEFMAVLASSEPAPGGGSASALSGAMGMALTKMIALLTVNKEKYKDYKEVMEKIIENGESLFGALVESIDKDTEAFQLVSNVFQMPKNTDTDKQARKIAMEEALKESTRVPFHVLTLSRDALKLAHEAVGKSNTSAASDLGVAAIQLKAAAQGAWLNVLINLGGIKDGAFVEEYHSKGAAILAETEKLADEVYGEVLKSIEI